jgi:TonB family protein
LDLFKRAAALTPPDSPAHADYVRQVSSIYATAILTDEKTGGPGMPVSNISMDQNLATTLRAEIDASNDPALLSSVGTTLVQIGGDKEGLSLIRRAVDLDPANPKWKEALDSAEAEPVRRKNLHQLTTGQAERGVRIGAAVAEANLLTKVAPKYPPVALQVRVQGTVEFTVDIGADGKVQSLQLVRGHPLLVDAAKDAVLQYVYRPTLLDGKPVPVTTAVDIPFTIP